MDGPEGNSLLDVQHTFINGTVVHAQFDGSEVVKSAADIFNTDTDPASGVILENIFVTSIPTGAQVNDASLENVDFVNVVFDVDAGSLSNYFESGVVPAGITAGTTGTKADASVFGWTNAGQAGELDGL